MLQFKLPKAEILLVHMPLVFIVRGALNLPVGQAARNGLLLYVAGSVIAYWWIFLGLRRTKKLLNEWRANQGKQMEGQHLKSLMIMVLDVFHILNMLFGWLAVSALLLFRFEHGQGISEFFQAFCLSVSAVGANATCGVELKTNEGQTLVLLDYFIGLVLLAYLVAIFTRSLELVRPIFGGGEKDAPG